MFPILTARSPQRPKQPSKSSQSRSYKPVIPAPTTRSSSARNSIDLTNAPTWHEAPRPSIFTQDGNTPGAIKLTREVLVAHNRSLAKLDSSQTFHIHAITINKSAATQSFMNFPVEPASPSMHDVHADRTTVFPSSSHSRKRAKSRRRSRNMTPERQKQDPQWLVMLLDSLLTQTII